MALLVDSQDFLPLFPLEDEDKSISDLYTYAQEIGDVYGITVDVREGSLLQMVLTPAGRKVAELFDAIGTEAPAAAMVPWSWAPYLDDLAAPTRISRLAATFATGEVTFAGANGTVIATGTQVAVEAVSETAPAPSFQTTSGGTISGGTLTLPIRAVEAGLAGNVAATAIKVIETPLAGLAVNNAAATIGGTDPETDDAFRDRIINAFQGSGPGNVRDYQQWAGDVSGIGHVTVIPVFAGAGTVLVIVTDPDGQPVSGATLAELQTLLDPPAFSSTLTSGVTLPTATIPVASTAGARPPGAGWIHLGSQLVQYTSFDADSFNGCAGGVGAFSTGAAVTQGGRGGGQAPVGAHVVVRTATLVDITPSATVECEEGYSLDGAGGTIAVEDAINDRLVAYISSVAPGEEIVLKRIEAAIIGVTGVHDVGATEINGVAANLTLDADPAEAPDPQPADLTEGAV